MDNEQIITLEDNLGIELPESKIEIFNKYEKSFLLNNSHTNLISKNDEKFLFEKHIFDSLAINLFFKKYSIIPDEKKMLDIGTGGGFPSVPAAIFYNNLRVFAVDSIAKKINIINEIKNELILENLHPICERVENLQENNFDIITSRAVASLDVILKYAAPKLNKHGYFVAYKSKKILDELKIAKNTIKKYRLKMVDIIDYTLPTPEKFERNLIVFKII